MKQQSISPTRTFAVLFSRGGHTSCWYSTQADDVVALFNKALSAWLIHEKRPKALVVVETKPSGGIKEDGEMCGFDDREHDNIITYYGRCGIKRVSV